MSAVMIDEPPTENLAGLTWDEFLALPYEIRNASLIDGEVVVNSPNAQHEYILQNLLFRFRLWAGDDPARGEMITQQPVKVNDRRGYQPDLAWYPAEQCSPPDEPLTVSGNPGLVVEVLSPSTRSFDSHRKRADYEHVGIPEVWFVDPPAKQVLVYRRPSEDAGYDLIDLGEKDMLETPLLEGISLPVIHLFARRRAHS